MQYPVPSYENSLAEFVDDLARNGQFSFLRPSQYDNQIRATTTGNALAPNTAAPVARMAGAPPFSYLPMRDPAFTSNEQARTYYHQAVVHDTGLSYPARTASAEQPPALAQRPTVASTTNGLLPTPPLSPPKPQAGDRTHTDETGKERRKKPGPKPGSKNRSPEEVAAEKKAKAEKKAERGDKYGPGRPRGSLNKSTLEKLAKEKAEGKETAEKAGLEGQRPLPVFAPRQPAQTTSHSGDDVADSYSADLPEEPLRSCEDRLAKILRDSSSGDEGMIRTPESAQETGDVDMEMEGRTEEVVGGEATEVAQSSSGDEGRTMTPESAQEIGAVDREMEGATEEMVGGGVMEEGTEGMFDGAVMVGSEFDDQWSALFGV